MKSMAAALAFGLMVAACAVAASGEMVAAAEDCSSALTDLLDCLDYVTDGSNTSSPSAGCCIGVANVVTGSPACICDVLKQARGLGVSLNTSRVLGLPATCNVKAPEMRCAGEIPPASSPSPSTAPSTAQSPAISPAPHSSVAPSSPPPSPSSAPTLTPTSSPPAPSPPAPSTEAPSPSPADAPASDEPSSSDAPQLVASLLLLFAAFAVTSAFN